jgi:hypothetical protein
MKAIRASIIGVVDDRDRDAHDDRSGDTPGRAVEIG